MIDNPAATPEARSLTSREIQTLIDDNARLRRAAASNLDVIVRVQSHDDALAEAGAAAARLGVALAVFQTALDNLRDATPKCECGWALGHRGEHRAARATEAKASR